MAVSDVFDKLFNWKHSFEYRGQRFYQRIVSDMVVEDARRFALLESRKLRRELRNENSDDYLIFIDPVHDLSDDEIRNVLVYAASRDVMQDYIRTNPRRVLDRPGDGATLEEQEEYEVQLKERDDEYVEDLRTYIDSWEEKYRAGIKDAPREALVRLYKTAQTDQVCNDRFTQEFEFYVIAHSLFIDEKMTKKAFTFEEFRALPDEARSEFRAEYNKINIGADDIKN